jgi:hypothetical protein
LGRRRCFWYQRAFGWFDLVSGDIDGIADFGFRSYLFQAQFGWVWRIEQVDDAVDFNRHIPRLDWRRDHSGTATSAAGFATHSAAHAGTAHAAESTAATEATATAAQTEIAIAT